jgi:hypothetical protein
MRQDEAATVALKPVVRVTVTVYVTSTRERRSGIR